MATGVKIEDKELDQAISTFEGIEMKALYNIAINEYKASFNNQGFIDNGKGTWKPSKKFGTNVIGKSGRLGSLTLVKSGNLRRSIKEENVNKEEFDIVSNLTYSEIHNEGGNTTFNGNPVKMPKRQFMGESKKIIDKMIIYIEKHFKK